jgi:hypothetical protein
MENLIREKLHKKISDRSNGNVLYIHSSDPVVISEWENCKMYSCNASSREVCVNFNLPDRKQLILSNCIKESSIDRKSYDNYGGIMYILEPLTEDIAETILELNII